MQAAGWAWRGIIAWDKQNARPQIGKFRQQCEYVLFATKGRFVAHTRTCLPGVYSYPVISAPALRSMKYVILALRAVSMRRLLNSPCSSPS